VSFRFHSRGGAYAALALLTLLWGMNWIVMKAALFHAHPVEFNVQRTWLATLVLFSVLIARGGRVRPRNLTAIVVTGFFQTTINFGASTMAVAGGGAGRTSVLAFTMPFWTLLIARFVLRERVRRLQAAAIASAFAGLVLVVAPWSWQGDVAPKLWAALSGFGWAAGTVAMKYYQRDAEFDMLNFVAWQMLIGILPLTFLPWALDVPGTQWSVTQVLLFGLHRRDRHRGRVPVVDGDPARAARRHRVAQHVRRAGGGAGCVDGDLRRASRGQRMARHRADRGGLGAHRARGAAVGPPRAASGHADPGRRRLMWQLLDPGQVLLPK